MRVPLIFAAVLATANAAASERLPGPYRAEILRVIDGDTVEARVHVWLGLDLTTRVRLRGIDTPELHGKCAEAGEAARAYLSALLHDQRVEITDVSYDKYGGRVDADVRVEGTDAGARLVAEGHAKVWEGRKRGC